MPTRFEVRAADSYAVCGPLTFDTVTAVWPQGVAALRGPGPIQIDLAQVSRTDSAGLALLVEWLRTAKASGTKVLFRAPPDQMQQLAEACHLDGLLKSVTAGI
ncbi:MAG: STAS domain-containing protein [Gammaproteobacteria bacterium]|nr:STAS domain-containing protein [Gammaproteobacteria bacterium]MBI5614664.1 STAS domain-containing protein [Gammaproteobacteria bacterium]